MKVKGMKPLYLSTPQPMTASELMAQLEVLADSHEIEDQLIMIGDEPLINVKVVGGRVVLQTRVGYFDDVQACKDHRPVQHRDGKTPWCNNCGLTKDWRQPFGYFNREDQST